MLLGTRLFELFSGAYGASSLLTKTQMDFMELEFDILLLWKKTTYR